MMCISLFSYGRPVVVRCMKVWLGMGWVGSWVYKFTWQWVGLGWVSYLVGWVGLMKIDPRTALIKQSINASINQSLKFTQLQKSSTRLCSESANLRQGPNLSRFSGLIQIRMRTSAGSLPKCYGFILLSGYRPVTV